MKKYFYLYDIDDKVKDILKGQIGLKGRIHPKMDECQLTIKKKGQDYYALLKGYVDQQEIKGSATMKKPLAAYLKANEKFEASLDHLKIKKEIQESINDFSIVI